MAAIPEIVLPATFDHASDSDEDVANETWTEVQFDEHHDISRLREAYEAAEVDRFMEYFETYVQEIRAPSTQNLETPQTPGIESPKGFKRSPEWSVSEEIAFKYILPYLPPAPPEARPFTYGRFRLALQRLYLAIEPVYIPFLIRLAHLCLWENKASSATYCAVYWGLWYYNLILPACIFYVLYALLWRRILTYPTAHELRHRQKEIAKADKFGDEITARLTASSTVGFKEIWRIAKLVKHTTMDKKKKQAKAAANAVGLTPPLSPGLLPGTPGFTPGASPGASTESLVEDPLSDAEDDQRILNLRQIALEIINEVADVHERIKNIFIWRRPASSWLYGSVIFFVFLITLFVPAQYIAKMAYMVLGIMYWHIIPVIAALPGPARARMPPALGDVPTDADYAMEIISKRVAAGLDVRPTKKIRRQTHLPSEASQSTLTVNDDGSTDFIPTSRSVSPQPGHSTSSSVDWKKWSSRAHKGKAWALEGKRILTGKEEDLADPLDVSTASGESYTYPCNHINTMAPGFVTLTPTTFYFTPVTSLRPKIAIPLSSIQAVRKIFKGLSVQWRSTDEQTGAPTVSDDKFSFLLVGNSVREELFARLLGGEAGRWQRV